MTEPMKTFEQLYLDWGNSECVRSVEKFMCDYGVGQVAAERERIKKLAKETRDEETNSIWIPQLFELIDSL